jgi:hypothetical protein
MLSLKVPTVSREPALTWLSFWIVIFFRWSLWFAFGFMIVYFIGDKKSQVDTS